MAGPRYEIVLCRREPQRLTIEMLAAHADMHPALVERFVAFGLIDPVEQQGATVLFDVAAVPRLRTIGRLRESLGINIAGIAVILDLLDRLSALKQANEMLRGGF